MFPLEARLRNAERKQAAETERKIRAAAVGLNVAIRTERGTQGTPFFVAVDGQAREMEIGSGFACKVGRERLRALLSAFAVGATAIVFGDERVELCIAGKEEGTS